MITEHPPKNFNPDIETASCILKHNGKIIILHRQDHKPQGNTWGSPTGKIDKNETPLKTISREVKEETGIDIPENEFKFYKSYYVEYPDLRFIYHLFSCEINQAPQIIIRNNEHKNFKWVTPEQALNMPLIQDFDSVIKDFFNINKK
ncbi:MAG: NUDIX hydrolase [Nanoarchaeota archaeon]|nr:NUDIX hydrolase [Nanoarchaeota archaeon]